MGARRPTDLPTEELASLLHDLLAAIGDQDAGLAPWETSPPFAAPRGDGRISATDQLNWWFRPAAPGRDPWEGFFDPASAFERPAPVDASHLLPPVPTRPGLEPPAEPIGDWAAMQLVLAEPEDELIDADADAVVTCLYDFVHAVGRRDLVAAMECVSADYHAMEGDDEIDRDTLEGRLKSLLDPFEGWELRSSIVEIPHPVPHPKAILVLAEMLLEARHPATDERRSILDRRIVVFRRQADAGWRISALSPL